MHEILKPYIHKRFKCDYIYMYIKLLCIIFIIPCTSDLNASTINGTPLSKTKLANKFVRNDRKQVNYYLCMNAEPFYKQC